MKSKMRPQSFADFERDRHGRVMEAERDLVATEMARHDIDADAVVIDGKVHRRVLRQSQTYDPARATPTEDGEGGGRRCGCRSSGTGNGRSAAEVSAHT